MYVSKPFAASTAAKTRKEPAWHPIREKHVFDTTKKVTSICGVSYALDGVVKLSKKLKKADRVCGVCANRLMGKQGSLSVWASTGNYRG